MNKHISLFHYFSKQEIGLWCGSVTLMMVSFLIFDRENYLTLIASFIGVTSLIYDAKGNPFGQLLMIIFSLFYGFISYTYSYYGEMITYLGMTAPMSIFAFISWIKNPYNGDRSEVKINCIQKKEVIFMFLLTTIVTSLFYFILKYFHTTHLFLSTISVATSFLAVYLTFRRSAFFALAYAINDIVLIFLWIFATLSDISYLSVITCFVVFLVNDLYTFISWKKLHKFQEKNKNP